MGIGYVYNLFFLVGGGPAPKTRLVVRHRPINSAEEEEMSRRLTFLEPLEEEEGPQEEPAQEVRPRNSIILREAVFLKRSIVFKIFGDLGPYKDCLDCIEAPVSWLGTDKTFVIPNAHVGFESYL